MTKNDWIKDILCDYMDVDVLDYLMKEELVDQIKKYFDERKIKIFDITEDINNINYIMVTKDDMLIAFKTFDSTGYKIDVVDINALIKSNFQVEEKNNTIKQLTEKLQQFRVQYHDYKATCTKIIDDQRAENLKLQEKLDTLRSLSRVDHDAIMTLCDKLDVKDDKIEELSTKLAKVVVDRNDLDEELSDKLSTALFENVNCEDKIEDLESIIEGQKEQIADLENEVKKLKDRLSPTSDKAVAKGPDKIPDTHQMPDYDGFRKAMEEAQKKMIEEQKKRFADRPVFGYLDVDKVNNDTKGLWVSFFNE